MAGTDLSSLSVGVLLGAYRSGLATPTQVLGACIERIASHGEKKIWIHRVAEKDLLERAKELERSGMEGRPLYGVPFAVKDNIDVAGLPTTAGCPAFSYVAEETAPAVKLLLDAGAILIGKTNLDQFATGLVGVRSPYGVPANPFNPDYIPGGSSSGSAVAVSTGLVGFALGTDTAGSGRVPAAFNNIVGLKPSRGALSIRGVVPACRSLDCISIFALTAEDAKTVYDCAAVFDPHDPFSRETANSPASKSGKTQVPFRFGVPESDQLADFNDPEIPSLFAEAVSRFEAMGGTKVEIDFKPFTETAGLLYDGPWVAERYAAVGRFIETYTESVHPVVRDIIIKGKDKTAVEAFEGYYRLEELRRQTDGVWRDIDLLLTPSAGRIYTVAEVEADPVSLNSNLGYYTNFVNLLDLCALAIPSGFNETGLPFGVTVIAPAFSEMFLSALAGAYQQQTCLTLGATDQALATAAPKVTLKDSPMNGTGIRLAVVGAHLSGMPLNPEITDKDGHLLKKTRTASKYRLYVLEGTKPIKPGLVRAEDGCRIELEIWELSAKAFGQFVADIPAPLGIGTLELEDGESVKGFLCEPYAVKGAKDVSLFGGWRAYISSIVENL